LSAPTTAAKLSIRLPASFAGLVQLALVVRDRAAAALHRWDHHLHPVRAEHSNGGGIHLRVEQPLHAAQHQTHPGAALTLGRHHQGEAIVE